MFSNNIKNLDKFTEFTDSPWKEAFDWLINFQHATPDGEHQVSKDMLANVFHADTHERQKNFFENHVYHIDIHFCLEGGEIIEFTEEKLQEKETYDQTKDATLFLPNTTTNKQILMQPGDFAIFLPHELHMPKISDGINPSVRKIVLKIKQERSSWAFSSSQRCPFPWA